MKTMSSEEPNDIYYNKCTRSSINAPTIARFVSKEIKIILLKMKNEKSKIIQLLVVNILLTTLNTFEMCLVYTRNVEHSLKLAEMSCSHMVAFLNPLLPDQINSAILLDVSLFSYRKSVFDLDVKKAKGESDDTNLSIMLSEMSDFRSKIYEHIENIPVFLNLYLNL